MSKSYFDLLRDPRWQRKRLEALNRYDFSCGECGDSESTLNVHHTRYVKGKMPWEYTDQELIVLCEACHKTLHFIKDQIADALLNITMADQLKIATLLVDIACGFVDVDSVVPQHFERPWDEETTAKTE